MAASKHLQIRAAVAAALVAGGVSGERVLQNRQLMLGTAVDSQVHVSFRRAAPAQEVLYSGHPRDWNTDIELVILARKFGGVDASDIADAMWVQIYGLLMADESLGGLADHMVPGDVDVQDMEGDTSLCRLTWTLTVTHRTDNNSISS
jgi:hypothetical protein